MMPKLFYKLILICLIFSVSSPLFAQSDSTVKKQKQKIDQSVDSEKNDILTKQTEELRSIRYEQIGDSVRLKQLKNEILELGSGDQEKKQILSDESDKIRNKDSLRTVQQKLKIDSLRSRISGFPVYLSDDTLFYIYTKLGSYTARHRAETDMNRIHKLTADYFFKPDSLYITNSEFTTEISYKSDMLLSISELDAIWMNSTKEQLAELYRDRIIHYVQVYKTEHSFRTIVREILLALLVLALLILLIYFILRIYKWLKSRIEKQKGARIRGVKIWNYEFLDTNKQVKVLISGINILKWVFICILIYLTLPVLLDIFPWTTGYSGSLLSYFLDPIKHILISIWDYLPNLFTIIVLLFVFRYLIKILSYFKSEIERGVLKIPGFFIDWANPTFQIIRLLVLAFMVIVIFPYLPGSDSQIFKGVSVFLGVLFTFGSAGALSNVVAGLVLTYMRAFKIGDRVRIGEAYGDVVEKSLLVTRIKTIKNEVISIPNSTVMGSHTTNYTAESLGGGLILHITVTIGYDTPWRQIHELLIKAALATELIEATPPPFVFQTSLGDFYVSYQINAYTRVSNKEHITYSHLHQNIQDVFNEAGVEIMSPHYSNIRDGNQTTVPVDHLPKDYVAPSFRVKDTGKDSS